MICFEKYGWKNILMKQKQRILGGCLLISSLPDKALRREACRDIENARLVHFDIKFTRQGFGNAS